MCKIMVVLIKMIPIMRKKQLPRLKSTTMAYEITKEIGVVTMKAIGIITRINEIGVETTKEIG